MDLHHGVCKLPANFSFCMCKSTAGSAAKWGQFNSVSLYTLYWLAVTDSSHDGHLMNVQRVRHLLQDVTVHHAVRKSHHWTSVNFELPWHSDASLCLLACLA
jgi:hypothetical protein